MALSTLFTIGTTVLSLFGAKKQYDATQQAGQEAQKQLDQESANTLLQGRSEAISYRQEGADIIKNMSKVIATQRAYASGANVDALSGSAMTLQDVTMKEGAFDAYIAIDNAYLAQAGAGAQAKRFQEAGRDARKAYRESAAINLGSNLINTYNNYQTLKLYQTKVKSGATVSTKPISTTKGT